MTDNKRIFETVSKYSSSDSSYPKSHIRYSFGFIREDRKSFEFRIFTVRPNGMKPGRIFHSLILNSGDNLTNLRIFLIFKIIILILYI